MSSGSQSTFMTSTRAMTPAFSAPFPPVNPGSGQQSGEHWQAFFERRAVRNARAAANETDQEKQSRLARETNAAKQQCPGRAGARVYVWDIVDDCQIRRAAGRSNYEDF